MDTVHALLELQERDLALQRLGKELDELPEKRAILAARAKLADIQKLRDRGDAVLRAVDAASKALEDNIATVKTKMDAEQSKLDSGVISNAKEVRALAMELDSLRRRTETLETDLFVQMEKRETAEAQVARIDAALVEGHKREGELTAKFKTHGGDVLSHIEAEKRARAAVVAALPPELVTRYETVRHSRHGIGVAVLGEGMCGACRVSLPSVKVQALEAGPEVGTCPGCGRILIVRGL
jgi:uncharacterized protein